jgi:uncharacterized membrane protein YphA (DoxX/SURF4 family)
MECRIFIQDNRQEQKDQEEIKSFSVFITEFCVLKNNHGIIFFKIYPYFRLARCVRLRRIVPVKIGKISCFINGTTRQRGNASTHFRKAAQSGLKQLTGDIMMKRIILDNCRSLILRFFLGVTVLFWGYEKLNPEKLVNSYTLDYEKFMVLDINVFLNIAGWMQILIGVFLFADLLTRLNSILLTLMGIITIVIPGMVVMKEVTHFAYAFALSGASIVLLLEGSGEYSLDRYLMENKKRAPQI